MIEGRRDILDGVLVCHQNGLHMAQGAFAQEVKLAAQGIRQVVQFLVLGCQFFELPLVFAALFFL